MSKYFKEINHFIDAPAVVSVLLAIYGVALVTVLLQALRYSNVGSPPPAEDWVPLLLNSTRIQKAKLAPMDPPPSVLFWKIEKYGQK